jgi:hypothetical protein
MRPALEPQCTAQSSTNPWKSGLILVSDLTAAKNDEGTLVGDTVILLPSFKTSQ